RLVERVAPVLDLRGAQTRQLDAAADVRQARREDRRHLIRDAPVGTCLAAPAHDVEVALADARDARLRLLERDAGGLREILRPERGVGREFLLLRDFDRIDELPFAAAQEAAGDLEA